MSQTIDDKLREIFHTWGEEPPQDAWDGIAQKRAQKNTGSGPQDTNSKLQEIFHAWGEEPPKNAWTSIAHRRAERAKEERKKRRRMLIAFFSGGLLMLLLLLPFILFKEELQTPVKETAQVIDESMNKSQRHLPSDANTGDKLSKTEDRPAETHLPPGVNSSDKLSKQTDPRVINSKATDAGPNKTSRNPDPNSIDNGLKYFKPIPVIANPVSIDEYHQSIGIIPLRTRDHAYNLRMEKAGMSANSSLRRPTGPSRMGLMLTLQSGFVSEATSIGKFSGEETAHKDASENYGKWLTAPKSGITFSAELNKFFGRQGWQFQCGFNYMNSEQTVHYDYTMRDVPVFWLDQIRGYLPLNDPSVYKMDQVNRTQRLSASLGIGKQLVHAGRWRISAFAYAMPNIVNSNKGSILNLNRNTFEDIGSHIHNKSMPLGYSARCVYRLGNGLEMFLQYARIGSRQLINISGAEIMTSTSSNKLTLGFQYPLIKK